MRDLFETVFLLIIGFVIIICLVIGGLVLIAGPSKEQEMYKHCIDDGNKDYVCYQMMHKPAEYVPMPIPVPMRVK